MEFEEERKESNNVRVTTYRSRTLLACLRSFSRIALLLGSSTSSSSATLEQLFC